MRSIFHTWRNLTSAIWWRIDAFEGSLQSIRSIIRLKARNNSGRSEDGKSPCENITMTSRISCRDTS